MNILVSDGGMCLVVSSQIQGLVLPAMNSQKLIQGEGLSQRGCNETQKSQPFGDIARSLESMSVVTVLSFVMKRGVGTVFC